MWLRDYHVDGLRLDAVHALHDERPPHILQELAEAADALSARARPSAHASSPSPTSTTRR